MRRLSLISLALVVFFAQSSFAATTDQLYEYLLKGDYNRVIQLCKRGASAENQYLLGLAYLKNRDYRKARDNLDEASKIVKTKDLKNKIALALADTYLLEQKFQDALALYDGLLKQNPNNGLTPILLLRLSQCNIKQGKWDKGNYFLSRLRADYPNSLEAQMSEPLSSTDEFFCVQAGSFTRQNYAEQFANDLVAEGYKAYISGVAVGEKTLYRVRVGECETRQDAEELKENLDSQGYDTKIYP